MNDNQQTAQTGWTRRLLRVALSCCIVVLSINAAVAADPLADEASTQDKFAAIANAFPALLAPPADSEIDAAEPSLAEPALLDEYAPAESPFAQRIEFMPELPEDEPTCNWQLAEAFLEALEAPAHPLAGFFEQLLCAEHLELHTELEDHALGLQAIPDRPDLLLEINERFLAAGELEQGFETPTGAIWRPSLWVFGTYRSAVGHRNNRRGRKFTEWANRLDLFSQLNLSGTERLLVGMRSLDKEHSNRRTFSGYDFQNGNNLDGVNADIQTLFFEGDFGEIFPNLDPYDQGVLDYGFSVGRQPMSFQQGLLINEDMIDSLTVTRNTLFGNGNLNARATGVFAWKEINRNNNMPDPNAKMVGLFTESDFEISTVNADIVYLDSETALGDMMAFGVSAIQRLKGFHNTYNTSFHVLGSFATGNETAASGDGLLLFSQLSWTPHHHEDLVYVNGFWAIDQFTSPSRGPLMGGPLGQTGILFASPGLGQFGAPLSNQSSDAYGGSIGYQLFYDSLIGQQVVVELGGRKDTNDINQGALGAAIRYQKRLDQHWIILVDGFATAREGEGVGPGARIELFAKF